MRALTVRPGMPESLRVRDIPPPRRSGNDLLVRGLEVGICGTDHEIIHGGHGTPPEGDDYLVLGHESLGEVVESPPGSVIRPADLVVGIVRHPDPVPCVCCSEGRWDMCRNGLYTERGIKDRHGYASDLWTEEESFVVKLDPILRRVGVLLEPASVVAKAWGTIDRLTKDGCSEPSVVVVTGAGPIGLLAAMMARQRDLEVHVLDVVTEGPKPDLVRDLGATYHRERLPLLDVEADVILECSGVADVFVDVLQNTRRNGVTCLMGVSETGTRTSVDVGLTNRNLVLENDIVFGSVNAAREHYVSAAAALETADAQWLERLITRRVSLEGFTTAHERGSEIKVVLDLAADAPV